MATQPKKMNIIKQVLTGHKNGLSVRKNGQIGANLTLDMLRTLIALNP